MCGRVPPSVVLRSTPAPRSIPLLYPPAPARKRSHPINEDPAVPCPYLASLLAISWTTDLSEHQSYISGNSFLNGLLDVRDDCWKKTREGLNDEGICIIDLSSLQAPAYCFVPHDLPQVMTAYEYIRLVLYGGSFTAVPHDAHLHDEERPEESESSDDGSNYPSYVALLDVFWSLVDLAGYSLISAEVVNSVWPGEPANDESTFRERTGRQLRVPLREDTPTPLDVVTSLYLGFATPQELDSLRGAPGEEEPHIAIAKAVLPPFHTESDEERSARMSVIYQLLREERAFQFVFEPQWPIDEQGVPPYSRMAFFDKLSHWILEMERRTGGIWLLSSVQAARSPDAVAKVTQAQNELRSLLHPSEVTRLMLRLAPSIEDEPEGLRALQHVVQNLDDITFIDLAFMPLTAKQVIDILRKFPGVEALSLSHNRHILADDIPTIVTSLPSLKRLHVMGHCASLDFDRLNELLRNQPLAFRNLESLVTPALISLLPTDYPAAFVFQHASRASSRPLQGISLPFFTPGQVIRALSDIIPLALREHRYGESVHKLGKEWNFSHIRNLRYGPMNMGKTKPADGTPFYMNVTMLVHASLSCGVPTPGTACMHGTWGFIFDWDHTRHRYANRGTNAYAFVYYERVFRDTSVLKCSCSSMRIMRQFLVDEQRRSGPHGTDSPTESGVSPSMNLLEDVLPGLYHYVGRTYDLHGFLRCMADEGRPLPPPEVVQTLDHILNTRDPATMERVCRLMSSEDVPHVNSASSQCEFVEILKKTAIFPDFDKPVGQEPPILWASRMPSRAPEGVFPVPAMLML
ncbi:hypothetical protein BV20DRAFT_788923 [Pilatotrama ljubarskyi]|nr:hypothetical protein BV20DRAFT_788923 [Pilatotrama ljubarskyi]